MCRIGIQPRVPEQRHRDLRCGDRKGKAVHSRAQVSGVPFGNAGDEVGGPGERQRGREAGDDGDDFPRQPQRMQGFVDRPPVETSSRDEDVPAGRVTGRRDLALAEGCPIRTTPMKRSRNSACTRSSGAAVFATTPVSRSTVPSRSGVLSLSGFGTKHSRTPGASAPTRAMRSGPKFSTKPSLVRSVNVRTSCLSLSRLAGRRTASASSTT